MHIAPFRPTPEEYQALAAFRQATAPHRRMESPAELQRDDADWPVDHLFQRLIARDETGNIIGEAICYDPYWMHRPGTVHLDFAMGLDQPQSQLLPALHQALLAFLDDWDGPVETLAVRTQEDQTEQVTFYLEHGYQIVQRSPVSELLVAEFQSDRFAELDRRLFDAGLQILALDQLQAQDPRWKQKLRDLRWALLQDVPSPEPISEPSLEDFQRMVLDDPALEPQAFVVAVDPSRGDGVGAYIGMSNLWLNDPERKQIDTGLTGVVRDYRRRGIATALKVRTIQFAQAIAAERITTSNEENSPMYRLNRKLGFQARPARLSLRRAVTIRTAI